MQAIIRFGELSVEQFVTGTVNNYLVFSPLPYSKQHSSGLDNSVTFSSIKAIEIIDADLDVAIPSSYDYSFSIGTDNKIKISFDKAKYADKVNALQALKCVAITYDLGTLTPNANFYKVVVRNSLGEEIHKTNPLTLDAIDNVVTTFDDTRELTSSGFLRYELVRDFIVN
ncbi:hypothetical protein D3C87_645680 [compost metagenome]